MTTAADNNDIPSAEGGDIVASTAEATECGEKRGHEAERGDNLYAQSSQGAPLPDQPAPPVSPGDDDDVKSIDNLKRQEEDERDGRTTDEMIDTEDDGKEDDDDHPVFVAVDNECEEATVNGDGTIKSAAQLLRESQREGGDIPSDNENEPFNGNESNRALDATFPPDLESDGGGSYSPRTLVKRMLMREEWILAILQPESEDYQLAMEFRELAGTEPSQETVKSFKARTQHLEILLQERLTDIQASDIGDIIEQIAKQQRDCLDLEAEVSRSQDEEHYTCSICFEEELTEGDTYRLSCGHRYCRSCLESYFKSRVDSGLVLVIPCPNTGFCSEPIPESDICDILDDESTTRYLQFRNLQRLRKEPATRWCPKPDCGMAIMGDPNAPNFPKLTCSKCGTEFCNECNLPWHEGVSCARVLKEARKNDKGAKKSENWKDKHKTRPCPQCRIPIHKDSGCNHMLCSSCGYQFCWICMNQFTPDHYFIGDCEGLQFSSYPRLRKQARKMARCCKCTGVICLLLCCCPPVIALLFLLILIVLITSPVWIICLCAILCCRCVRKRRRRQQREAALSHVL